MEKDSKNTFKSKKYMDKSSSSVSTCHTPGTDELIVRNNIKNSRNNILRRNDKISSKSDFDDILWLTGC